MDGAQLKATYERQLESDLGPPVEPGGDWLGRWQTRCMLRVSRGMAPGVLREDEDAGVWVWSDLHLGHAETVWAFGRPFGTADEMDDEIFSNWRRVVAPEDTILILGDVTVDSLSGRRLTRVREAPGWKILVYGNHDITRAGVVDSDSFDEVWSTLYVDGDPPLLLTHMALRVVPEGCVNVHGHLHQSLVSDWATPHINVSVEQLEYRPCSLASIRGLAGRLAAGGVTVRGLTTAEQLRQR